MSRSRVVHPILGARRPEQLIDNLGALDVVLTDEARRRLESATRFDLGFPSDFRAETQGFVYGPAGALVTGRNQASP